MLTSVLQSAWLMYYNKANLCKRKQVAALLLFSAAVKRNIFLILHMLTQIFPGLFKTDILNQVMVLSPSHSNCPWTKRDSMIKWKRFFYTNKFVYCIILLIEQVLKGLHLWLISPLPHSSSFKGTYNPLLVCSLETRLIKNSLRCSCALGTFTYEWPWR